LFLSKALSSEDKCVTECSASSTSVLSDSEGQGEKRKRGRPKKFPAPPFLDGVEERQDSQIAPKRSRGRAKLRGPGGQFGLNSVGCENYEREVAPGDSLHHPVASPPILDGVEERQGTQSAPNRGCQRKVQRTEGTTQVVPNYPVLRPFPVQPPLDPNAPKDVREGNKSLLT
jgi:hypothetical protein